MDSRRIVLDEMAAKGTIEWLDKQHNRCLLYWRSPSEWAALLYQWVLQKGLTESVCTLYDLHQGDLVQGEGRDFFLSFESSK